MRLTPVLLLASTLVFVGCQAKPIAPRKPDPQPAVKTGEKPVPPPREPDPLAREKVLLAWKIANASDVFDAMECVVEYDRIQKAQSKTVPLPPPVLPLPPAPMLKGGSFLMIEVLHQGRPLTYTALTVAKTIPESEATVTFGLFDAQGNRVGTESGTLRMATNESYWRFILSHPNPVASVKLERFAGQP
jgi:hypothetical protein